MPGRLILFIFVLCYANMLKAQTSFQNLLKNQTEKELRKIIESSSSVTGFMALDLTSGDTFSFNEDLVFPQGSAIKIPILMEVYKQSNEKRFALTDLRKVDQKDIVGGTGVLKDLTDDVSLSIRNLGILMIVLSDNSATNSLLSLVGMDNINATMTGLGLKSTKVRRRMIDQAASGRGEENVSCPADAVQILRLLYEGKFINKDVSNEITDVLKRNSRSNSRLAAGIPSGVSVAFKPGVLDGVSTEWAIVYLAERPYAVAVMEAYKVKGEKDGVVESLSKVLYDYFWRKGNGTQYGTYVSPALIK